MPLVTLVVMPAGLAAMLLMPFGLDALPLQIMGKGLEGVIAVANYVDSLGGDITVGSIPLAATVTAGAGLIILLFLRSWLRLSGLVLIGFGALLTLPPFSAPGPDILISEDANLVVLAGPEGLASNAARPSAFVFNQWQTALRGKPHLPPESYPRPAEGEIEPADILDPLLARAASEPSRFHCAGRGICAATHRQLTLIVINQAALIGAACDRADIVVVAIPVHMTACWSGATLVTSRSLRRSGAMTISISDQPLQSEPGLDRSVSGKRGKKGEASAGDKTQAPQLRISTALAGVIRPWTVQRYYDWRSQSYDLPK